MSSKGKGKGTQFCLVIPFSESDQLKRRSTRDLGELVLQPGNFDCTEHNTKPAVTEESFRHVFRVLLAPEKEDPELCSDLPPAHILKTLKSPVHVRVWIQLQPGVARNSIARMVSSILGPENNVPVTFFDVSDTLPLQELFEESDTFVFLFINSATLALSKQVQSCLLGRAWLIKLHTMVKSNERRSEQQYSHGKFNGVSHLLLPLRFQKLLDAMYNAVVGTVVNRCSRKSPADDGLQCHESNCSQCVPLSATPTLDSQDISLDGPNILLIDDNLTILRTMERLLTRIGYAKVTTVLNGREAVKKVAENDFDIVILDYRMPDLSGPEVSSVQLLVCSVL